jgi:hypothetical protein
MMPLERTGAFTLACVAVLLVVALAIVFLWQERHRRREIQLVRACAAYLRPSNNPTQAP